MIFRRFLTTPAFRKALEKLPLSQKKSTAKAFAIFKKNPFDPRLRAHKIYKLSAHYGKTVYAVVIEADLRAVFYIQDDCIVTLDIGPHAIYK